MLSIGSKRWAQRPTVPGGIFRHLSVSSTRLSSEKLPENSHEKKLLPEVARAEAAKLAIQSMKDLGSLFSSSSDDSTQPIDTKPVFENYKLFGTLSLLHQGQVLKELQAKFDSNWNKLTLNEKQMGYYIAYGNWGAREKFSNWNTQEPPLDLPFHLPSQIRTTMPLPKDKVHELEPVILAETPIRKEEFDTSKMDPMTKTFIYITIFITMLAFARDKKIGEEGKPKEVIIEDQYLKLKQEEQKQLENEQNKESKEPLRNRKWYYLWLK